MLITEFLDVNIVSTLCSQWEEPFFPDSFLFSVTAPGQPDDSRGNPRPTWLHWFDWHIAQIYRTNHNRPLYAAYLHLHCQGTFNFRASALGDSTLVSTNEWIF